MRHPLRKAASLGLILTFTVLLTIAATTALASPTTSPLQLLLPADSSSEETDPQVTVSLSFGSGSDEGLLAVHYTADEVPVGGTVLHFSVSGDIVLDWLIIGRIVFEGYGSGLTYLTEETLRVPPEITGLYATAPLLDQLSVPTINRLLETSSTTSRTYSLISTAEQVLFGTLGRIGLHLAFSDPGEDDDPGSIRLLSQFEVADPSDEVDIDPPDTPTEPVDEVDEEDDDSLVVAHNTPEEVVREFLWAAAVEGSLEETRELWSPSIPDLVAEQVSLYEIQRLAEFGEWAPTISAIVYRTVELDSGDAIVYGRVVEEEVVLARLELLDGYWWIVALPLFLEDDYSFQPEWKRLIGRE